VAIKGIINFMAGVHSDFPSYSRGNTVACLRD
jgi:hypothetical protein